MKYGLINKLNFSANDCLVLGLFSDTPPPSFINGLESASQEMITTSLTMLNNAGEYSWQGSSNKGQLLLINLGKTGDYNASSLSKRLADLLTALSTSPCKTVTLALPRLISESADWQLEKMLLQIDAFFYQLLDFKTDVIKRNRLECVNFYLEEANATTLTKAQIIADAISLTKNLANLPANICTPTYLADQASQLAKRHKTIKTKILNVKDMTKMGMNTLLAVAKGSLEEPRFIEIRYSNGGNAAPIVLVGKGITFDSGGISIKPANAMEEMKYDMSGAASVIGTLDACAQLHLPINVVGLIAAAENMPSGGAVKPGDIIKSLAGLQVEIVNTDAEGRLVLADALSYAEQFNPEFVIDIATLTGAVIIALGHVHTGLMTQDDALADLILQAAKRSLDKTWRLPLDEDYQSAIESPIADIVNSTFDRSAGSITAACFLSRFTKKYRWAHLDIAGTAWISGKQRNATGRPVPLLMELLKYVATR